MVNILETTEALNKRPKLTKPVEWGKFKQPVNYKRRKNQKRSKNERIN